METSSQAQLNFFMFCGVACDYSGKTIACDVDQGSELQPPPPSTLLISRH